MRYQIALVLSVISQLGGCAEYMERADRVALSAGDAVEANKAVHIVDPWPKDGFNTASRTIGQRLVAPVERYHEGSKSNAPVGGSSASSAAAAGGVTTQ